MALVFCCLLAWPARAQAPYPSQGIRLIVPYAAGGVPDTVARFISQGLQERLGQSVVVENRPGGNGSVAAGAIVAAPADGYTLLVTDSAMLSVNPLFFRQLAYSAQKDFVPVAQLARAPLFLAVHADVPVGGGHTQDRGRDLGDRAAAGRHSAVCSPRDGAGRAGAG